MRRYMGMKKFTVLAVMWAALTITGAQGPATEEDPQFTTDGQPILPKNYREWIYLTSGLGMTYGPAAEAARDRSPEFDNVFVTLAAYRVFKETGKWPDKTMFALEVRHSESKGSINNGGHFQGELAAFEVEVKDEK